MLGHFVLDSKIKKERRHDSDEKDDCSEPGIPSHLVPPNHRACVHRWDRSSCADFMRSFYNGTLHLFGGFGDRKAPRRSRGSKDRTGGSAGAVQYTPAARLQTLHATALVCSSDVPLRHDGGDQSLWHFVISFRSSRAIMSVTLISLEYGPRQSCLSP